jgi:integron integrase
VREAIRVRHYSSRTERVYLWWIRRFVYFHGGRPPEEMGGAEVGRFLSSLALRGRVSASTQNQAFSSLLFLYREVLGRRLGPLHDVVRAKEPARRPQVLSRSEVAAIMRQLRGMRWLMASLMYGAGLRLLECCRLRVRDLDFDRAEITVRDGKGGKDRVTLLPATLGDALRSHLEQVRRRHLAELRAGAGGVTLSEAGELAHGMAAWDWNWQWVFPASRSHVDRTGRRHRHHVHPTAVQRAFKEAVQAAGLAKPASCHTLRHCFATHLVDAGYDIRTVQELMGHRDVSTTMIYARPGYGGPAVRSPLDFRP